MLFARSSFAGARLDAAAILIAMRLPFVVCALGAVACTTSGGARDAEVDAQAASLGLVQVDRPVAIGAPELSGDRASIHAAFARYHGVDAETLLDLLGGRATAMHLADYGDHCERGGQGWVAAPDAEVELIDVGAMDVSVEDAAASVRPRTFPELGVVAGVFYAEDASLGRRRADLDEYVVHAEGSEELGGFELRTVAPRGFQDVRLDGALPQFVAVTRERGLDVTWDAGDSGDRIEIELLAGGQTVSCVGRDDGALHVARELLETLSADDHGRLVVRRVRIQPADVAGLDTAIVGLSSTASVDVTLR